MRRALRTAGRTAALLLGVPVLAAAALLVALNTAPGRRLAERLIAQASGGQVTLQGMSGRFPDALHVARIELRDEHGAWLVVRDAALDWSPLLLVRAEVSVARLAAAEVDVARLPASSRGAASSSRGLLPDLPVRVDVASLLVDRLSLGAPVAGIAATLAAEGSAHLASSHLGDATLTLRRLDGAGRYHVEGRIDEATLAVHATAEEPAEGLLAQLAGLPDIGALSLSASADGKWSAAAMRLAVAAGALRANAQGQVDFQDEAADLDVTGSAPAMAPRPDLGWQSVALEAHLHGPFSRPRAQGTVRIAALEVAGAEIGHLAADLAGDAGALSLSATAEGVRVPGPSPDLFAAAPVSLRAEARLDAAGRPVTFTLTHTLLSLQGQAQTEGPLHVQAHLDVPDLAPLAAAGGADLQGRAALDLTAAEAGEATTIGVTGTFGVTGGMAPLPALLGPEAKLALVARLAGDEQHVSQFQVDGQALHLSAEGGRKAGRIDLAWQLGLADLSALAAGVQGKLTAQGHLAGTADDFSVRADLSGEAATAGMASGALHATLAAEGLPGAPSGHLTAEGKLAGAPLVLAASAERAADATLHVTLDRAAWQSLRAEGTLTLPPHAVLPQGKLTLRMDRLDDFRPLIGLPLAGSVSATLDFVDQDGRPAARVQAEARDAGLAGTAAAARATLAARVLDPLNDPNLDATLDLAGLRAGGLGGTARLSAAGRQTALALTLATTVQGLAGADLQASAAATLDAPGRAVRLTALQATWQAATLRLLAPVRIGFGDSVTLDRARLGVQQATLELSGRLAPTLDLTASLRGVTPDLARPFLPTLQAAGTISADARLTGTPAQPSGTVRLTASGLRMRTPPLDGLPPASLTAEATLAGATAQVRARAQAGRNEITLDGTAPIDLAGPLQLRAQGSLDLVTIDPLIAGAGQIVRGHARLDATLGGTLTAPRLGGSLLLTGGSVQDFALGAHLTDIAARIEGAGDTVRLASLSARAGQGSIAAHGTVGLGGAMPVDLALTARNATPLASDRLTATLDADLALRGDLLGALAASGTIKVDGAEIRIPERLPASIPVLQVHRLGQPPPPPPSPGPDIGLDVTLTAPGQVFLRGRGIFAELAGRIHLGGTTAALRPDGAFRLRRGDVNLAGRALNFSSGSVRFEGGATLDPALNLVATSTNGSITATLTVGGFASAPKITLSSVPEMPQDEVLSQLLFQRSANSLGPAQVAEAAAAVARLSGLGGGAFDALGSLRQGLGLDRLSLGASSGGGGAAVEAGRYLARGVYLGARQATSGAGTQATVQIDLMRGLKLETSIGTGGGADVTGAAATANPYGTSVGLTYQFQY